MIQAIEDFFLHTVGAKLCVFFCSLLPIIECRGAIPLGCALGLPWWQTYLLAVAGNLLPVPFILLFIRAILRWMVGKPDADSASGPAPDDAGMSADADDSRRAPAAADSARRPDADSASDPSSGEIREKELPETDPASAEKPKHRYCRVKWINRVGRWLERKVKKHKGTIEKYSYWGVVLFVAIPIPGTGAWTGSLIAAVLRLKFKKTLIAAVFGVLIASAIMTVVSYAVKGIAT